MKYKFLLLAMLLSAFVLGSVAQAQTQTQTALPNGLKIMKMNDSSLITDTKGMKLYVYDAETGHGKSTCNGTCAQNWPPLTASADAKPVGPYTIVTRDDGTKQWAYKGKPLYFWKNDKQPMDMTGDGVGGKWHVAKP